MAHSQSQSERQKSLKQKMKFLKSFFIYASFQILDRKCLKDFAIGLFKTSLKTIISTYFATIGQSSN